jgi:hypothetical protein
MASWKRPLIIRMPANIRPPKQMYGYERVDSGLNGQGAQIRGAVTRHFGIRKGLDLRS